MTKLLLALVATATLALAADPFLGSWKPNIEKSKLSPERSERRRGEAIIIESAGKDKYQVTVSRPDGKTANSDPRIWIVDGKEHQEQGPGVVGTTKVERISELHLRTTTKAAEKVLVYDWAVTADGKTLTVTPKGKPDEFLLYSKQ